MIAKLPPGPRESSLRQALRFGAAPLEYFSELARRYGDTFTLRLPGDPPRVVCSHPEDIRRVLALPPTAYTSRELALPLNLGKRSLLFLDGDEHLADRRLMVPALHGERVTNHVATIEAITAECVAKWPRARSMSLGPELHRITLDVILRCVFGLERGPRVERCARRITEWLDAMLSPTLFSLSILLNPGRMRRFFDAQVERSPLRHGGRRRGVRPWPWQRIADRKAEVMAILEQEIAELRERGAGERCDVLATLIDARYEDGTPMSDATLVDELLTLLVGGHETTATALGWLFAELLLRPDLLARVRDELARECPEGPLEPASLRRLRLLDACILESLRLHPIAPAISRHLVEPLALRECEVPAGALVWASLHLAHTNTDTWSDPLEFRPERFLAGEKPPNTTFLPFGGGRRRCLGMTFAGIEMLVVAATILRRTDLRAVAATRPKAMFRGITIAPGGGLPVIVSA
jgi:cytochrome P450